MSPISLLKTWRPYAVIIIIGFLLYAKTLSFDFVEYDDRRLIAENQSFLSDLSNLFKAFTQDVFNVSFHRSSKSYYRPVLTASLMLDAHVGGTNLFIYRITNLIIHILTCCVLFLFFGRMGFGKSVSLLFSVIFLVHPILTQAVAWIPGRNDSLLALFSIASIICLIKFTEGNCWLYYIIHLFFFALAIFTKETALGLIAICFLYYLINERLHLPLLSKISALTGWIAVILLWFTLRSIAVENPDITVSHIIKSIYINLPGLIQYLGKVLLPINLSVYPIMEDMPLIEQEEGPYEIKEESLEKFDNEHATPPALVGMNLLETPEQTSHPKSPPSDKTKKEPKTRDKKGQKGERRRIERDEEKLDEALEDVAAELTGFPSYKFGHRKGQKRLSEYVDEFGLEYI